MKLSVNGSYNGIDITWSLFVFDQVRQLLSFSEAGLWLDFFGARGALSAKCKESEREL